MHVHVIVCVCVCVCVHVCDGIIYQLVTGYEDKSILIMGKGKTLAPFPPNHNNAPRA